MIQLYNIHSQKYNQQKSNFLKNILTELFYKATARNLGLISLFKRFYFCNFMMYVLFISKFTLSLLQLISLTFGFDKLPLGAT